MGNDGSAAPRIWHRCVFAFPPYGEQVSGQLERWVSGGLGLSLLSLWDGRAVKLAHKCPTRKKNLSETSEQAKSCSSFKVFPYCFLLRQNLYHNRLVMNTVGHSGWPRTSAPGLLRTAQLGSFREAPVPAWGEPSILLNIQRLLGWCFWPTF